MKVRYLGHSAFRIETGEFVVLIDPFVEINKDYDYRADNITHILVTHGHGDHLGSALQIAKAKNALIVGVFELANYCSKYGVNALGLNLGGWVELPFGLVQFTPALHSSSFANGEYAGCPAGILMNIEGKTLFHAGDSALTQEYKTLRELNEIELAMLPVGGLYTMGVKEAAIAASWLGVKQVIPMHYNTFNAIEVDINLFEEEIKKQGTIPRILKYCEEIEL